MSWLSDHIRRQFDGPTTLDDLLQVYGGDGVRALAASGQLTPAQREALIDRVLDEELPRNADALRRLGE